MADQNDSQTVKAGARTYFFDLKETTEGQSFLTITESQFKGEGQDRERVSIAVFPEHAQEFMDAIQTWEGVKHDEGALLHGVPLAIAREKLAERRDDLTLAEQDYIQASADLEAREAAEKDAQRQRELETAQKLAEEAEARRREQQQANARLRGRAVWIAVVGVAAIVLAVVAVIFGVQANQNAKDIALQKEAAEGELNFYQTTDPQIRINYLVTLLGRPGYESQATKLFWGLPTQAEQLALFKVKNDGLVEVIKSLDITLADVNRTRYSDPILAAMVEALATNDQTNALKTELEAWKQAREKAREKPDEAALAAYDKLIALNDHNPAVLYERAAVQVELADHPAVLADLERVMALVDTPVFPRQVENGADFSTVEQVTQAVRRLIEITPELGRLLNNSASTYPHLQHNLVLTSTPTPKTNDVDGAKMVLVPAGKFNMGSNAGGSSEQPVHEVTLDAFYIDQYEVTNAQYADFLQAQGNQIEGDVPWLATAQSRISQTGEKWQIAAGYANHPVTGVSWYGAEAYCKWRKGRLPTEAEWEKAARGADGRTYPWGEHIALHLANYFSRDTAPNGTTPVGHYPAGISPYGAYDMAGNVWEWVADWYDANYYSNSLAKNPPGPPNRDYKVLRGGSWNNFDYGARATDRNHDTPDLQNDRLGFRCAAGVP